MRVTVHSQCIQSLELPELCFDTPPMTPLGSQLIHVTDGTSWRSIGAGEEFRGLFFAIIPKLSRPSRRMYVLWYRLENREALAPLLASQETHKLLHEQIIQKLDEAGKTFKVLIMKTPLTIP
ncbi:MAG: hypothetical protein WBE74_25875 [Terracidiphilus sp.]